MAEQPSKKLNDYDPFIEMLYWTMKRSEFIKVDE
jgi:hypothetical protein